MLIFRNFMRICIATHKPPPEAPWEFILCSDGATPGNPIAVLNNRKFHAISLSFLEFGQYASSREVAIELSTHMSIYSAGLSQAFAAIVAVLVNADGTNLSTTGFLPPVEGGIRIS